MATSNWEFIKGTYAGLNFTSKVLSATITQGREKYLDPYSGGVLRFTINNTGEYASNFAFNDKVVVRRNGSGTGGFQDWWTVQEIDFQDYPGNTGLPTATITCVDALGRAGRYQATSKALTQVATYGQAAQFNGDPLPSDLVVFTSAGGGGNSTASAQTYTGTVLNQINSLNATERGVIRTGVRTTDGIQYILPYARNQVLNQIVGSFTFNRTASSAAIAYQEFDRIQNGLQFINTATVSPLGLADQTEANATSVTTYGAAFYSSSTVDYDVTQADGNAAWIANTFSDPASLRFRITFSDLPQNSTAYFNYQESLPRGLVYTLTYRVPGAGSDTTINVVLEGWTVQMTPAETRWTLNLSPLTYYQFFTLDSSTLGILDTSRLGW